MSYIFVLDVETTGLVLRGTPSDDPKQPHIVQFAGLLVDRDTQEEVEAVNVLVRPDGWQIPPETTAIHGISHVKALARGIPEKDVVDHFCRMQNMAELTVAHNLDFDALIMRIAMLRYGSSRSDADERAGRPSACTMKLSVNILNLPPTERMLAVGLRVPKAPKLTECMQHFFNEEHEGAHDALADARACSRVFFRLQEIYKQSQ